jgi:hypothetical protein
VYTISEYLIARIPEISVLLATMIMVFVSDLIMGRLLLKRLREMGFISRTIIFVLYCLLVMPSLTVFGAMLIKSVALEPLKDWIILFLVVAFLLTGILLSLRYKMKVKLNGG